MDIATNLARRSLQADIDLLALLTLIWSAILLIAADSHCGSAPCLSLIAVGASGLATLILKSLGYFNTLRVVPQRSEVALMLIAVPCGLILQLLILQPFGLISSTAPLIIASPFVAVAAFGAFCILSSVKMRMGLRRKVVLFVSASERAELLQLLFELRLIEQVQLLNQQDLPRFLEKDEAGEIDLIVISKQAVSQFDLEGMLIRAHLAGVQVIDITLLVTLLTGRVPLHNADQWMYLMSATPQTIGLRMFAATKRSLEPLGAIILGILLLPILLLVAAAIKLSSSGPVFFTQVRTGHLGRPFTLIKFRSMYIDAEASGPQWAAQEDPRVTPLGKWLRKTRLDELPQLWNVLRGDMVFLGPRPERPEIYQALRNEIPLFGLRTIVKPGISGWAQVCAGYAASIAESKLKLEYDLYYIQHMSPRLDFIVLLKTIEVAVLGDRTVRPVAAGTSPSLFTARAT